MDFGAKGASSSMKISESAGRLFGSLAPAELLSPDNSTAGRWA
jgi:hypothetical protein